MATNKLPSDDLPADLPEEWKQNDAVTPTGEEAGLTKQHGYNYLMKAVNLVHTKVNEFLRIIKGYVIKEDGTPIIDVVNQISNPNLLINGDFHVWQRGTIFEPNSLFNGYTADRWRALIPSGNSIKLADNKSGLVINKSIINHTILRQPLEADEIFVSKFIGKNVTLSIELYSNSAISFEIGVGYKRKKINLNAKGTFKLVETFLIEENDFDVIRNALDVLIFSNATDVCSVNVFNVKLELGSIATPFVPGAYAEELALCERYYQVYQRLPIRMYCRDLRYHNYVFILPVEMRKIPSITYSPDSFIIDKDSNLTYPSPIANGLVFENNVRYVCARKLSTLTIDTTVYFGTLYIDAEIY